MHLHRKVGPWIDGIGFAKRIGQLLHVDLPQHRAHAHLGLALGIIDENELGALRFREIAEEAVLALVVVRFRRRRGDGGMAGSGVTVERLHAVVERGGHRSADRMVAGIVRVTVKHLRWSDVGGRVGRRGFGTGVTLILVITIGWKHKRHDGVSLRF